MQKGLPSKAEIRKGGWQEQIHHAIVRSSVCAVFWLRGEGCGRRVETFIVEKTAFHVARGPGADA
jgi:hypothetical protein